MDQFITIVTPDSEPSHLADPSDIPVAEPILVDAEYWSWGSSSQSGFCLIV